MSRQVQQDVHCAGYFLCPVCNKRVVFVSKASWRTTLGGKNAGKVSVVFVEGNVVQDGHEKCLGIPEEE